MELKEMVIWNRPLEQDIVMNGARGVYGDHFKPLVTPYATLHSFLRIAECKKRRTGLNGNHHLGRNQSGVRQHRKSSWRKMMRHGFAASEHEVERRSYMEGGAWEPKNTRR